MIEEFRDIEGYEGKYQVSNLGNVKSLNYHRTGKEKILKPRNSSCDYLFVRLYINGKGKNYFVHRLVANAFIPNPNNLPQVNHKSEIKNQNTVDNLEWCTNEYNCNYGTHNKRVGEKNKNGKCSKPVLQFDLEGNFIKEWPSAMEIQRQLGYYQTYISACCNRKRKSAHKFIWRYKTAI